MQWPVPQFELELELSMLSDTDDCYHDPGKSEQRGNFHIYISLLGFSEIIKRDGLMIPT